MYDVYPLFVPLMVAAFAALTMERILAILVEFPFADVLLKKFKSWTGYSLMPIVAMITGFAFAYLSNLDAVTPLFALSEVLSGETTTKAAIVQSGWGKFVTGILIAGGSQGAVKLFQDVMSLSRENRHLLENQKLASANAAIATANLEAIQRESEQTQLELQLKQASLLARTRRLSLMAASEVSRIATD